MSAIIPPYSFSGKIETMHAGFQQLAAFHHHCKRFNNCTIDVNFDNVTFFDANLSAPLLSFAHQLKKENGLSFRTPYASFGARHLGVLHRNGFAKHFCGLPWEVADNRESTVPIKAFKIDDADGFAHYIERDLFRHRGLNSIAYEIVKQLKSSYYEIFDNVGIHANTPYPVIACGQYFPAQGELKFTLTDLGIGFKEKIVIKTANSDHPIISAPEAISWAVKGGSTKDEAAGGNGLKKILMYCRKNNGSLHIYSDQWYWAFDGGITTHRVQNGPCGASISLIFRNL